MNSLRVFKFGGRVGHVRQLFKVKRSRSHGHAEEIYAVKGSRDIRPVYDHLGGLDLWPLHLGTFRTPPEDDSTPVTAVDIIVFISACLETVELRCAK